MKQIARKYEIFEVSDFELELEEILREKMLAHYAVHYMKPKILEKRKEFFAKIIPEWILLNARLEKNGGDFACGNCLSWVDFFLYSVYTLYIQYQPELAMRCNWIHRHAMRLLRNEGLQKFVYGHGQDWEPGMRGRLRQ